MQMLIVTISIKVKIVTNLNNFFFPRHLKSMLFLEMLATKGTKVMKREWVRELRWHFDLSKAPLILIMIVIIMSTCGGGT